MQQIKRIICLLIIGITAACSTTKNRSSMPLTEILMQRGYGGADFEFYEIFSSEKEVHALLQDPEVRKKVQDPDYNTTQFVLLSMGQKMSGGYRFEVDAVDRGDSIELQIRKIGPQPGEMATDVITNPMALVKVNSAKPIVIQGLGKSVEQ